MPEAVTTAEGVGAEMIVKIGTVTRNVGEAAESVAGAIRTLRRSGVIAVVDRRVVQAVRNDARKPIQTAHSRPCHS